MLYTARQRMLPESFLAGSSLRMEVLPQAQNEVVTVSGRNATAVPQSRGGRKGRGS
jgi:hypothetical protein